jgi:glutamate synthase domain-containing protein 3
MRGDEAERACLLEAESRIVGGNALDQDGRLACFFGALINYEIGNKLFEAGTPWIFAGMAGAIVGAVWNYGVTATFTGRVPHGQVAAYLDACDIVVAPHVALANGTEFFGSPTKLFEYMSMARPVIASRLGQIGRLQR